MESPRKMLRPCNLSKQNEQIPSLSGIHNRSGFMSEEGEKKKSKPAAVHAAALAPAAHISPHLWTFSLQCE